MPRTKTLPKKKPRKKAKPKTILQEARARAAETGDLPHEWLLKVSRGEPIIQRRLIIEYHKAGPKKGEELSRSWIEEEIYPSFDTRVDAAKASAPFYAPRLATQTMQFGKETTENIVKALATLAEALPV